MSSVLSLINGRATWTSVLSQLDQAQSSYTSPNGGIAAGDTDSVVIAMPGAAVGSFVLATYVITSQAPLGAPLSIQAHCRTPGEINVLLHNPETSSTGNFTATLKVAVIS